MEYSNTFIFIYKGVGILHIYKNDMLTLLEKLLPFDTVMR